MLRVGPENHCAAVCASFDPKPTLSKEHLT
jgi:hypothetical protein